MDRHTYRNAVSGEEAHLSAGRVGGAAGVLWWSVTLVRADGSVAAVAGQPAVAWYRTREEAREGYRERLGVLRDAGCSANSSVQNVPRILRSATATLLAAACTKTSYALFAERSLG